MSKSQLDEEHQAHPYDAIVVGAGRLGGEVIQGLLQRNAELLVVDYDPNALRQIEGPHVTTLYGDVSEPEFAASLPFHETNSVICAVPNPATNVVLLQTLKRYDFHGRICLTALDTRTADLLSEEPGVTVIRPFLMAAESIVTTMNVPVKAERHQVPRMGAG